MLEVARRSVLTLLASAIANPRIQRAWGAVPERSEEDFLSRQLYAPAPAVQSYRQQLNDAITVQTMRGVWQLSEYSSAGKLLAEGVLTFRGADSSPDKGTVVYQGGAATGRGPWILKPDGFGRR